MVFESAWVLTFLQDLLQSGVLAGQSDEYRNTRKKDFFKIDVSCFKIDR